MDKGPRILFMGTPEFAVASLGALLINNYNVVGVVTSPDKPAGRGRKISRSAVADYATVNLLNLLQPSRLKDPSFIKELKNLAPDIAVVVAFRMLPEDVWQIPGLGTFNLHASLLPQYRGAAPINHAIINGEKSTGITTFLIDHKIDTGNILLRRELKISHTENAGELHDRLMRSGAELVVRTVELLASGEIKTINQEQLVAKDEKLKSAPKIFSRDCYIDWTGKSETIYNFIRGLSPYPGARTIFNIGEKNILLKILEAKPVSCNPGNKPGSITSETKRTLRVTTSDGYMELITIQAEGKRVMKVSEFLPGIDTALLIRATSPQV